MLKEKLFPKHTAHLPGQQCRSRAGFKLNQLRQQNKERRTLHICVAAWTPWSCWRWVFLLVGNTAMQWETAVLTGLWQLLSVLYGKVLSGGRVDPSVFALLERWLKLCWIQGLHFQPLSCTWLIWDLIELVQPSIGTLVPFPPFTCEQPSHVKTRQFFRRQCVLVSWWSYYMCLCWFDRWSKLKQGRMIKLVKTPGSRWLSQQNPI